MGICNADLLVLWFRDLVFGFLWGKVVDECVAGLTVFDFSGR